MGDVLDLILRLGALTEHPVPAARLVTALDARIRMVVGRVAALGRPRVLYVLWPEPVIVPGRGALVSELIALAGGDSVTADSGEGYPRYSLEAVVARAPQLIILADHGAGLDTLSREQWERVSALPAVKAGRLFSVDHNLMHHYGPPVVEGLELLARLIHPEAFTK
jgi:iron complex transport system substrate-binding protein